MNCLNDILNNKTLINGKGTVICPDTQKLDPHRKYFIATKDCGIPYTCMAY